MVKDRATDYAKRVEAGRIITGESVRLACRRHLDEIKASRRKSFEYRFDVEKAQRAISFIETFCKHSKGEWAGKAIKLEPWQCFIVGAIFGWVRKADGCRRYSYFYIQVARKNGKSTLMACIGLYALVADGEMGAEVYSAATKRDQARIIFDEAKNMVNSSPELKQLLSVFRSNISFVETLSKFEPLSADVSSLDGLNVSCGLIDELHAHKNSDVYDVLDSATGARRQPLIGVGTTAGTNPSCFCKQKYDVYKSILRGSLENDNTFIYIAEPDETDDWTDPDTWIKSNPNLGVSVYMRDLEIMCSNAQQLIAAQNNFKCKRLNMWVQSAQSWADMRAYNSTRDCISKDELIGRRCYIGADLAMRNDLASVDAEFPLENGYSAVIHMSFIPEERILANSRRDNVDYQRWIDEGYIIATPGNAVDFDYIEQYILKLAQLYNVVEVCLDPWNATQLMSHLIDEGLKVVEVRMGYRTLSEPTKDLQILIADQKLTHFNDPVLKWAVGNVVVTSDENDNIRPNKSKCTQKIDPAMALIIAHTRAYTDAENYVDVNAVMEEQLKEISAMFGGSNGYEYIQ